LIEGIYAGGTCGNVLAILAFLGWNAYPIARLNGDLASIEVTSDLRRVGVRLDLANVAPGVSTPIVVQVIEGRGRTRRPQHRFASNCPECGSTLPKFRAIPRSSVSHVAASMKNPDVFFMDRLSRSALDLARVAAGRGGLVYFEPSAIDDPGLFEAALETTHVLKYACERLPALGQRRLRVPLEIQTRGARGLAFRGQWLGGANWISLPSIRAPRLVDSCGAGDWLSAGLIARLAAGSFTAMFDSSAQDLIRDLRFGQALAAWNCGYHGARGGMYKVDQRRFAKEVSAILGANISEYGPSALEARKVHALDRGSIACPACLSTLEAGALADQV